MNQISQKDLDYFNGANRALTTESSVLISSSPYLNHPRLPGLIAQEMLRRNGADLATTAYIPEVATCLFDVEDLAYVEGLIAAERVKNPEFAAWLDRRHLSNFVVDDVKDCAPGTLGSVIHDFLTNSGYQIDYFFQGMPVETDYDYYKKERVFTHDIEHMVTGFETDFASEVGLIFANLSAFYKYFTPELASEFCRVNGYLSAKSMMRTTLFYPRIMSTFLEAQQRGIMMGQGWKKPLMLVAWRDHLDWTIPQIREEYAISGSPEDGAWSWTTAAVQD